MTWDTWGRRKSIRKIPICISSVISRCDVTPRPHMAPGARPMTLNKAFCVTQPDLQTILLSILSRGGVTLKTGTRAAAKGWCPLFLGVLLCVGLFAPLAALAQAPTGAIAR